MMMNQIMYLMPFHLIVMFASIHVAISEHNAPFPLISTENGMRNSDSVQVISSKEETIRRRLQDEMTTSKFHTFPIYQGFGAQYIEMYVGSPPQRQTMILDTGSENIGLPCAECVDCGDHHTDPLFQEKRSESFRWLQCSECLVGSCEHDDTCSVRIRYAEKSGWCGKEVEDLVYIGENPERSTRVNGYPLKFSCMESVDGAFQKQLADGIVGLSLSKGSLWSQMHEYGFISKPQFSFCFNVHPLGARTIGAMTLGGLDERLGHRETDMSFMRFTDVSGLFEVTIRKIHVRPEGGERMRTQDGDLLFTNADTVEVESYESYIHNNAALFDTGTTATLLSSNIKDAFQETWEQVTGRKFPTEPLSLSPEELQEWPTIVFQMQAASPTGESVKRKAVFDDRHPYDVLVALPPSKYMHLDLVTGQYLPTLILSEDPGKKSILGSTFMRSHNIFFDLENKRIGMVESDCDYNKILKSEGKENQMDAIDPYATLNEIVNMYHDNLCKYDHKKCMKKLTSRVLVVLINGLFISYMMIRYRWIRFLPAKKTVTAECHESYLSETLIAKKNGDV